MGCSNSPEGVPGPKAVPLALRAFQKPAAVPIALKRVPSALRAFQRRFARSKRPEGVPKFQMVPVALRAFQERIIGRRYYLLPTNNTRAARALRPFQIVSGKRNFV